MKIKVNDLTGHALDFVVSKLEKDPTVIAEGAVWLARSRRWNLAGPIIERENINLIRVNDDRGVDEDGYYNNVRIPVWAAVIGQNTATSSTEHQHHDSMYQIYESDVMYGVTPLIAAMRCYVASRLGKTVEIPEELI